MSRAKTSVAIHKRTKKILKAAKGYYSARRRLLRTAKEAVTAAGVDAYFGRKQKKRDYRSLWITRISAATRALDFPYGRFINGLKKAQVVINRKMMAELAVSDPKAFEDLVNISKKAL